MRRDTASLEQLEEAIILLDQIEVMLGVPKVRRTKDDLLGLVDDLTVTLSTVDREAAVRPLLLLRHV